MKFIVVLTTLCLFIINKSHAQDYDNAGIYMSAISKQRENISKKFMSYASAAAHGKRAKKVDNLRQKLLNEVQEARMNIAALPSFKGDKGYRDTSVNFMKLYYNILNEDYGKILDMEELAEQSYDEMEIYLNLRKMVDQKLDEGNIKMKAEQQSFANKYNITLIKSTDELSEKTKQVAESNDYYYEVYLVFFKANIQEQNMLTAMEKNNMTGVEQSKNSMLRYAEEGLEKLKPMKPFQGDFSLLGANRNMLNFYKQEAAGMNNVTDYNLAKDRFEQVKQEFDKKRNRTKEDTDNYNKAINEINAASQNYNKTINSMNSRRSELLNEWNKAVKVFFDEHTPRYK